MNLENLQKLRDHLAAISPAQFDMSDWATNDASPEMLLKGCGTAACIAGWCAALERPDSAEPVDSHSEREARDWLDLDWPQASELFTPDGIDPQDWHTISRDRAVKVIDHLMATGAVEWDRFQ